MWLPEDGSGIEGMAKGLSELGRFEVTENVTAKLVDLTFSGWSATPLGLRVRAVVAGGVG